MNAVLASLISVLVMSHLYASQSEQSCYESARDQHEARVDHAWHECIEVPISAKYSCTTEISPEGTLVLVTADPVIGSDDWECYHSYLYERSTHTLLKEFTYRNAVIDLLFGSVLLVRRLDNNSITVLDCAEKPVRSIVAAERYSSYRAVGNLRLFIDEADEQRLVIVNTPRKAVKRMMNGCSALTITPDGKRVEVLRNNEPEHYTKITLLSINWSNT